MVLTGAASVVFVVGFVVFAYAIWTARPGPINDVDGIVVLTGGEKRIQEGMRLFALGGVRRILISGVNRSTTRDDVKRLSTINPVLFDCCVDIGYEALDTIGNAEETKLWAETWHFKRLVVVTSHYHMPRSMLEFARTMPTGTQLIGHPVVSRHAQSVGWWFSLGAARLMLSEYVKVLPAAGRWALGLVLGPVGAATAGIDVPESPTQVPASFVAPPRISKLQ
ncbi:MAG: YdcF family protein [Hyphomicrobiaceae bacterium]